MRRPENQLHCEGGRCDLANVRDTGMGVAGAQNAGIY